MEQKNARALRVRSKLTKESPRLSVFRSGRHIWAQIIDDRTGQTLASLSSKKVEEGGTKTDVAKIVGLRVAEVAKKKGVKNVVFDRGAYKYHGRVKALAEGAREGGLIF